MSGNLPAVINGSDGLPCPEASAFTNGKAFHYANLIPKNWWLWSFKPAVWQARARLGITSGASRKSPRANSRSGNRGRPHPHCLWSPLLSH